MTKVLLGPKKVKDFFSAVIFFFAELLQECLSLLQGIEASLKVKF